MPRQSVEHHAWAHMIQRCTNPNHPQWKNYGGRGITVCERWLHTSKAFLADMGPHPSPDHCLDRINNDLGYSPENCRWTTYTINNQNRRTVPLITWRGRTMSLTEWAKVLGIKHDTLYARIGRKGWPIERAMTEPMGHGRSTSQKGHTRYPLAPEQRRKR